VGKYVTIATSSVEDKNYIKPQITNQLVILESNIIKKLHCFDNKKYDITSLQLNIGDYTFISQFSVQTLWNNQDDIILGSAWMETQGSFILNTIFFNIFIQKEKKNNIKGCYIEAKSSNTRRYTRYFKSNFSRS